MASFNGRFKVSLDDKGRLAIPAKLRAIVTSLGSEKVYVTKGADGCLDLFPEVTHEEVAAKMAKRKLDSKNQRFVKRVFHSNSYDSVPDKQGRIQIPPPLREHAGLERDVLLLGVGEKMEIWNPQRYDEYESSFKPSYEEVIEDSSREET